MELDNKFQTGEHLKEHALLVKLRNFAVSFAVFKICCCKVVVVSVYSLVTISITWTCKCFWCIYVMSPGGTFEVWVCRCTKSVGYFKRSMWRKLTSTLVYIVWPILKILNFIHIHVTLLTYGLEKKFLYDSPHATV